ncbi:hypothetical protein E3O06_11530 [Cryobacterium glaciale]|uniref:Leucine-rich repeat domain-containing protein n=1 Tax=Cryobacterium glaciale TaxID=1259145 RepID=A0A4R8UW36_9MICO|nr:leucine-rich repeat protein [Cryobacterium glaciale]TFB71885.1 hypothetical protein E3O06_11530 [Cryobacterium glaciale]
MTVLVSQTRRGFSRVVAASVAGVLVAGSIALAAMPAHAIVPNFVADNGITYLLGDVAGEVTVVGYNQSSPKVVIPADVTFDAKTYLVTAIGNEAFWEDGLTEVVIGANVTAIGNGAFASNLLKIVDIPASVSTIGAYAFSNNYLATVSLHDGLTEINDEAFLDNELVLIDVPATVTRIGAEAFGMNALTSVTLHEGLTSIQNYAFWENPLTTLTVPASVKTLGRDLFYMNDGSLRVLTSVTFVGAAPTVVAAGGSDSSLGNVAGLTVHYLAEFEVDGGFTPGTWQGYNSVVDTIVSFNMGGHGSVDAQRLVPEALAVAPLLTAEGWVFGGWFSDAALTAKFNFAVAPTADVTVFAKWTAAVAATPSLVLDLGLAVGDAVAGKTVTVSGAGLKPSTAYDVVVRSTPATIAFGSADASGTFAGSGVIPAGLAAGAHTVTLSGTAADGTAVTRVAYFSINTAGVVTYLSYSEAQAVLAATGFDPAPLGFAALLLLLAGGAIVAGRRRSVA